MSKKARLKMWCITAAVGIIYFIWLKLGGVAVPCAFRLITGYKCPGCGITHVVMNLARLDFRGAFACNQAVCIFSVVWVVYGVCYFTFLRKNEKADRLVNTVLVNTTLVALILFGVARNIWL